MNRRGFLQLFAAAAIAPAVPKPAPLQFVYDKARRTIVRRGPLPPLHINCRSTIITRRAP